MAKREPAVSDQDLDQLATLFWLLADRTRLTILLLLLRGERNVASLCQELGLPQPTVSHHLGLLKMHNLIGNRRHGRAVFYGVHAMPELNDGNLLEFNVQNLAVNIHHRRR